jgi:hypothetical protein
MRLKLLPLTFLCSFAAIACALAAREFASVEGPVVAIQRGEKDTRIVDPPEFADLHEIYLVRVDRWSQPHNEKYIVVEYIHQGENIAYNQFDKVNWKFALDPTSSKENDGCHSWIARSKFSFIPTAFGAKAALPNPKELPCFLVTKPPVPLSPKPSTP